MEKIKQIKCPDLPGAHVLSAAELNKFRIPDRHSIRPNNRYTIFLKLGGTGVKLKKLQYPLFRFPALSTKVNKR